MEFKVEISQALESLKNDFRYGKMWKNPENCEAYLENLGFHYTVDYSSICLLLCLHFESHLVFRNTQRRYSAQTANTICSLRNFDIRGAF